MDGEQWQYLWQQLGRFADAISIIGAGASIYAAWQIRTIVKRFRFRAEVPKLVDSIEDSIKKLSQLLGKFDKSQNEILKILAQSRGDIKTLAKQLIIIKEFDNEDQKNIVILIETIGRILKEPVFEERKVREIWAELIELNQRIKNLVNLLQWEQ